MGNVNTTDHSCDHSLTVLPASFKPPSSNDASLSECRSVLSFRPGIVSTMTVPMDCVLNTADASRPHKACIRFKIRSSINSQVVVGLGRVHGSESPIFIDGTFANVTLGRVINDNRVQPDVVLPISNEEGEVRVCIDVYNGIVRYSVTNPDNASSSPIINLSLNDALPTTVMPMVGILSSGVGGVTVAILPLGNPPVTNTPVALGGICFDSNSAFGPVEISSNGTIARRGNTDSNCVVVLNQVMKRGKYTWSLKVSKDFGSSICLGIARHPLRISQDYENIRRQIYTHQDLMLWRSYKGLLYADGDKLDHSLEPIAWTKGGHVLVKFILDLDRGELEIIRNGISLGVAFKDVQGPVCPAVAFYASYEKEIELVHYGKGDAGKEPNNITGSDGVNSSAVPGNLLGRSGPLPAQFLAPPISRGSVTTPIFNIPVTSSRTNPLHTGPLDSQTDSNLDFSSNNSPTNNLSETNTTQRLHPGAVFDATSKHGSLSISDNGLSLNRTQQDQGNAYCLLNKVCNRGCVYRWSFKINTDQGASTCFGIASEPVKMCSAGQFVFRSKSMWLCRSFEGSLYMKGTQLTKSFAEFWMDGSTIELTLDLPNDVLHYSINDSDQGVAFCNLKDHGSTYRPIVAFYAGMEKKVTLLKFEKLSRRQRQISLSDGINDLSVQMDAVAVNKDSIIGLQDSTQQSSRSVTCIVCSVEGNNVGVLPCQHIVYCPMHAETADNCIICGVKITGVWNVFS